MGETGRKPDARVYFMERAYPAGRCCSKRATLRPSRLTSVAGLPERIFGDSKRSNANAILGRLPAASPEMRSVQKVGSILFFSQMSNSTAVNSSYQP